MFIAELKNQLITAGHDLDALRLPLTLDVARGDEIYTLMRGVDEQLKAGDMYIRDQEAVISSIIYGPDQRTQICSETRRVLFTVYAPAGVSSEAVRCHLEDIRADVELVSPQAQLDELEVLSA
ncbi:MAG TPA: hypothetical protein VHO48_06940 [Anaerolineaceae bacterium]|nr:hypothetical protein [Anaerolineaceae bacterium]